MIRNHKRNGKKLTAAASKKAKRKKSKSKKTVSQKGTKAVVQVNLMPSTQSYGTAKENKEPAQILVVDVGGTHVKILESKKKVARKFNSGPKMTAEMMVSGVQKLAQGWQYDAISIGYPGVVLHGKPLSEPYSLGGGWVGFDFQKAFGCPVKLINDAAMQAMGSYEGGKMLFLGLGTGLGSTMIADGIVEPTEVGHLPYKKHTYEYYLGKRGVARKGKKQWRQVVAKIIGQLIKALEPDYVVIGGGNVKDLKKLPDKCRLGENANAFKGGLLLWGDGWQKYQTQLNDSEAQ